MTKTINAGRATAHVTLEAGRAISAENGTILRKVATGVNEAMHPLMRLVGMKPSEAVATIAQLDEAARREAATADAQLLLESANIAEWYEAQIHKYFTCMADDQYGYGTINRAERIALSSAIGSALDAFRAQLQAAAPGLFKRMFWDQCPEDDGDGGEMEEASAGAPGTPDQLPLREASLRERAVAEDGTFEACLITPGWGSSGYYSAEVLQRDGPRIFTSGLQMFLDHASESEKRDRPERSVKDLAATLRSDAAWQDSGWNGPGLYARAEALPTQREAIDALAAATGLSIYAYGVGHTGEVDGRKGVIIDRLTGAESVDVVTRAGRGGAIRVVREDARTTEERTMADDPKKSEFDTQLDREQLRGMQESIRELQATNARLQREAAIANGAALIRRALAEAELPELSRARLAESLRPVLTEAGALDSEKTLALVQEAADREAAYVAQLTGRGRVAGLGGSGAALTAEAAKARLAQAFERAGLSKEAAQLAAEGR
jgi:hypothetical protein